MERTSKPIYTDAEIQTIIQRNRISYCAGWGIVGLILGLIMCIAIGAHPFWWFFALPIGCAAISTFYIGWSWWFIDCAVVDKWAFRGFDTARLNTLSVVGLLLILWPLVALCFYYFDKNEEERYQKSLKKKAEKEAEIAAEPVSKKSAPKKSKKSSSKKSKKKSTKSAKSPSKKSKKARKSAPKKSKKSTSPKTA